MPFVLPFFRTVHQARVWLRDFFIPAWSRFTIWRRLWIGIKFIHLVGQQSPIGNFVEDNSVCKVIKMPLTAFYLLENKWTPAQNKRETIKKCKLQTEILFQMKNWTKWKITFVKYRFCCFFLWLISFLAIIPSWDNNFASSESAPVIYSSSPQQVPWWIGHRMPAKSSVSNFDPFRYISCSFIQFNTTNIYQD